MFQLCDVMAFRPRYDPAAGVWYVDIAIEPGSVPGPYVSLSMARFQPHTITDPAVWQLDPKPANKSKDEPVRDLSLSEPQVLGIRLEPHRRVSVTLGKKDKAKGWPVYIRIRGPLSYVSGGDLSDNRPEFRMTVLRGFSEATYRTADGNPVGGELCLPILSREDRKPTSDTICDTVIYLAADPRPSPHFVYVEEVEHMLSSAATFANQRMKTEAGPRFSVKVRIGT